MQEKQTFKIRVRQYADNSTWSMSHHDLDTYENAMDDIVCGVDDNTPYREFDVEITSRPPEPASLDATVPHVEIPDVPPADPAASAVAAIPA